MSSIPRPPQYPCNGRVHLDHRHLHELFGESVTRIAEASGGDLSQHVFTTGQVYPSMFMTREEVLAHGELNGCKRFIVIRDLRDTLVALYFSMKLAASSGDMPFDVCQNDNEEADLLEMPDTRLARIAAIQASWLNQGEIVLRYEDLMEHGFDRLRDVFIRRLALPVSEKALHRAIREAPSERGRRTGAIDWRHHFTPKVRARFVEKFGQVLIDSGYEKDRVWASSWWMRRRRERQSTSEPRRNLLHHRPDSHGAEYRGAHLRRSLAGTCRARGATCPGAGERDADSWRPVFPDRDPSPPSVRPCAHGCPIPEQWKIRDAGLSRMVCFH